MPVMPLIRDGAALANPNLINQLWFNKILKTFLRKQVGNGKISTHVKGNREI